MYTFENLLVTWLHRYWTRLCYMMRLSLSSNDLSALNRLEYIHVYMKDCFPVGVPISFSPKKCHRLCFKYFTSSLTIKVSHFKLMRYRICVIRHEFAREHLIILYSIKSVKVRPSNRRGPQNIQPIRMLRERPCLWYSLFFWLYHSI